MTERKGLSCFDLRLLATVTMVIDHLGAIGAFGGGRLCLLSRLVGRLAFPIYAFLLAGGAMHTSSFKRYLLRIFGFALLSEPIYDRLFHYGSLTGTGLGALVEFGNQNILFTLLLGLMAIRAEQLSREKWKDSPLQLLGILSLFGCCMGAVLLNCDYGYIGVLTVFGMYVWRSRYPGKAYLAGLVIGLGYLMYSTYGWLQAAALGAFIPLMYYNEKGGLKLKKWMYYGFYPGHLLVLLLVQHLILHTGYWAQRLL